MKNLMFVATLALAPYVFAGYNFYDSTVKDCTIAGNAFDFCHNLAKSAILTTHELYKSLELNESFLKCTEFKKANEDVCLRHILQTHFDQKRL